MATPDFTTEELAVEEWRTIPGWDDYRVSNLGRVRRVRSQYGNPASRILASKFAGNRYPLVVLKSNGRSRTINVHRLVADAFIGTCPPGKQVNHKDGDKTNSRATNLEYVTPKENVQHAAHMGLLAVGSRHYSVAHPDRLARGDRNGARLHPERLKRGDENPARLHPERMARGSAHGRSVLTEAQVREIRILLAQQVTRGEIAARFGVSRKAIYNIAGGHTWRHVP